MTDIDECCWEDIWKETANKQNHFFSVSCRYVEQLLNYLSAPGSLSLFLLPLPQLHPTLSSFHPGGNSFFLVFLFWGNLFPFMFLANALSRYENSLNLLCGRKELQISGFGIYRKIVGYFSPFSYLSCSKRTIWLLT